MPTSGAAVALAAKLRELRTDRWPDVKITQRDLAAALGERKSASVTLISSWEHPTDPKLPTEDRLEAYAAFFSTAQSVAERPFRLTSESTWSDAEKTEYRTLLDELQRLRRNAQSDAAVDPNGAAVVSGPSGASLVGRGPWHFTEGPVVIVCAEVPEELRGALAASRDPDTSVLYGYADLGSLVELHGHIRAVNPDLEVRYCRASEVTDFASAHLVLLGGVDWNEATRTLPLPNVPVRQHSVEGDPRRGCFKVTEGGKERSFSPEFAGDSDVPTQDVGHLLRAPSPVNFQRTITVCNGMFGKGVYGAVRTLTDSVFRDRNMDFLTQTFGESDKFSVLFRVRIIGNKAITPDWNLPDTVLHTWSEERS